MSNINFNLKPVRRKSWKQWFTLTPVDNIPPPNKIQDLTRTETIQWAQQYDLDHPWWVQEEQKIKAIIQKRREIDLDTLH